MGGPGEADIVITELDEPAAVVALYESLDGIRKPQGDVNYWWELG